MTARVPTADLIALLPRCPEAGSRWRHANGSAYVVTGAAIAEDTLTALVLYAPADEPRLVWARPLAQFLARFTREGASQA